MYCAGSKSSGSHMMACVSVKYMLVPKIIATSLSQASILLSVVTERVAGVSKQGQMAQKLAEVNCRNFAVRLHLELLSLCNSRRWILRLPIITEVSAVAVVFAVFPRNDCRRGACEVVSWIVEHYQTAGSLLAERALLECAAE